MAVPASLKDCSHIFYDIDRARPECGIVQPLARLATNGHKLFKDGF